MDTNADEISRAMQEIGIPTDRFRRLPRVEAETIYESSLRHFVPVGRPRWWWEHFEKSTAVHFVNGNGRQHLAEIVPNPEERVWFIAEDSYAPEYSVWEASTGDIQAIVGECYGFEYYIVQKQFRWLVCENHHKVLIGVGIEIEEKLREYNPA